MRVCFAADAASDALVKLLVQKRQSKEAFVLALDGRDGAGKTTLGHMLALRTGCDFYDADLLSDFGETVEPTPELQPIVERARLRRKPLILAGVFVARSLTSIGRAPEMLVRIIRTGSAGCDAQWAAEYECYEGQFIPDHCIYYPCLGSAEPDRQCYMLSKVPDEGHDGVAACAFCLQQSDPQTRLDRPWHV